MTTSCDVFGTLPLELPSPTFVFPFTCEVTILPDHPPLVILPADGLVDVVALTTPHVEVDEVVGELVIGVVLPTPLVNLPLGSLRLFMHSTYHDLNW
jgi:hypothetical protein